ncbi:hypothetical protein AAG570_013586 [Ranatra chinensis]|uniref:MPN domain-containing protein n=1 Tax=Ranatra chinensis TaxID=642074 RepID=A0ABD0YDB6_9HEMI
MEEVTFSSRAYCKMILHAAKYPHCAVNGVLLAEQSKQRDGKKSKTLQFVDAIPLFHLCLHVSPMAEVALMQVDTMASSQGLMIAGYYTANEILDDMSIDKPGTKIAEKIVDIFNSACLVMIDNSKVTLGMEETPLRVLHNVEGKWKQMDTSNFMVEEKSLFVASVLLQQQAFPQLVDFDNHLDDLSLDWRNLSLNSSVDALNDK